MTCWARVWSSHRAGSAACSRRSAASVRIASGSSTASMVSSFDDSSDISSAGSVAAMRESLREKRLISVLRKARRHGSRRRAGILPIRGRQKVPDAHAGLGRRGTSLDRGARRRRLHLDPRGHQRGHPGGQHHPGSDHRAGWPGLRFLRSRRRPRGQQRRRVAGALQRHGRAEADDHHPAQGRQVRHRSAGQVPLRHPRLRPAAAGRISALVHRQRDALARRPARQPWRYRRALARRHRSGADGVPAGQRDRPLAAVQHLAAAGLRVGAVARHRQRRLRGHGAAEQRRATRPPRRHGTAAGRRGGRRSGQPRRVGGRRGEPHHRHLRGGTRRHDSAGRRPLPMGAGRHPLLELRAAHGRRRRAGLLRDVPGQRRRGPGHPEQGRGQDRAAHHRPRLPGLPADTRPAGAAAAPRHPAAAFLRCCRPAGRDRVRQQRRSRSSPSAAA